MKSDHQLSSLREETSVPDAEEREMLFERSTYDRLVQEAADARDYAVSISGVSPVVISEAEVELRLRAYPPRLTHDSGVHDRVKAFCLRTPREVRRELTTVYLYEDNLRRVVDEGTLDENYQRKTQLYRYDNTQFSIRSVVSREDTLGPSFRGSEDRYRTVRKRDRTRISYEGVFLDLTTTTTTTRNRAEKKQEEPTVAYEVEIEIPDISTFAHPTLNKIIRTIFRVVRDTEVPYPVTFYSMMAEFYNSTLSQEVPVKRALGIPDFDTRLQSRARTLKIKDLVYGGIVGPTVHYSVTAKADGVRTVLMIHNSGVWMYSGNGLLNCLILSHNFDDLHGTIVDLESIPMANRTAAEARRFQYFLVAFDMISTNTNFARGSTAIQGKDHQERMLTAEALFRTLGERLARNNPLLVMLRTKTFYYSISVDQFFDAVASARHLIDSGVLPYKTDGLVFTPSNLKVVPYPGINNVLLSKRILSDYPDIVKFKTVTQLTIDFAVDVKGRQIFSAGPGNSLLPFTARGFNSSINVAWNECEERRIPRNAIVEFEWRDSQFHPLKLRPDREQPNRLDVSRDNMERIHEGITYDTVGGLTGVLMTKYHNRIKTLLYSTAAAARSRMAAEGKLPPSSSRIAEGETSAPPSAVPSALPSAVPSGSTSSHTFTLLDLGSGIGGDLSKWAAAGFTHVVAVEPSASNVIMLRERLESLTRTGREAQKFPEIEILQTGAEDTDAILTCSMKQLGRDSKFDVISSMISASFFWKDDDTLANVVRTIKGHSKKGTLFTFLTINGQLIEEMVSPSMREGIVLESPIVLGDVILDLPLGEWQEAAGRRIGGAEGQLPHATGRSYHITFKGSKTVRETEGQADSAQREYMVYIPMLTQALKPEFVMKSHSIATGEPLLLGPYRIASSLYSFGMYERVA